MLLIQICVKSIVIGIKSVCIVHLKLNCSSPVKKYLVVIAFCLFSIAGKCVDTIYVEGDRDMRYLIYLDSLKAYETGFSVAQNIADTIAKIIGNRTLDNYFLQKFYSNDDTTSGDYFYAFHRNVKIDLEHVNEIYHGTRSDSTFPWEYLEQQYKRLNYLRVQPRGVMMGAELPNVYVYARPVTTVVIRAKVKRFTVVDYKIRFLYSQNGKTKTPYIIKYTYVEFDKVHQRIEKEEKLDPVTLQPIQE